MEGDCYVCGTPARYTCDAPGCGRPMCEEHATLVMFPPAPERDAQSAPEEPDHAHLCRDHAPHP